MLKFPDAVRCFCGNLIPVIEWDKEYGCLKCGKRFMVCEIENPETKGREWSVIYLEKMSAKLA